MLPALTAQNIWTFHPTWTLLIGPVPGKQGIHHSSENGLHDCLIKERHFRWGARHNSTTFLLVPYSFFSFERLNE